MAQMAYLKRLNHEIQSGSSGDLEENKVFYNTGGFSLKNKFNPKPSGKRTAS
jgi:hypothetical protein